MADYTEKNIEPSTHIVIFTGGKFPSPEKTAAYWKNVKSPDFVIVADSGLYAAEQYDSYWKKSYNFTPDIILGDMDSLSNAKQNLDKYPKEKIIIHNPYKDYTDTELALDYAYNSVFKNSQKIITLVGGDGGRIDHLLGIFDLFSSSLRPSVWLLSQQSLWYAPKNKEFSIFNLNLDDYISIARPNGCRSKGKISDCGLEWGCNHFRTEGMPSISNRISSDFFKNKKPVQIKIIEGEFIMILPLSASVELKNL